MGRERSDPGVGRGRLLPGATPLGQPADASKRLIDALSTADVIAAEDTRRVRTLTTSLGVTIRGRVISLFDQNETAESARWSRRSPRARRCCWSATPACH